MNSNPLQMMIQMTQKQQQPQNPPIDPQRFCQMAPKLTKENLVQLAQQTQNATLIGTLRPFPQPAYITCSPYQSVGGTCGSSYNCGCGI